MVLAEKAMRRAALGAWCVLTDRSGAVCVCARVQLCKFMLMCATSDALPSTESHWPFYHMLCMLSCCMVASIVFSWGQICQSILLNRSHNDVWAKGHRRAGVVPSFANHVDQSERPHIKTALSILFVGWKEETILAGRGAAPTWSEI